VLKAVVNSDVLSASVPIIVGSARELRRQADELRLRCDYPSVSENELALFTEGPVICDTGGAEGHFEWGVVSANAGRAAIAAIETATTLCLNHRVDAIATAPINKAALKLAGSVFPGHTEMLASLCKSGESLMCFFAGDLRVFLLTIHLSLADAIAAITKERVTNAIVLADHQLRRFGISRPRIAVAGLNPHAGEGGLFGSEEAREIEPAIAECRRNHNVDVLGPFPADTLFVRASRGDFDAVAACYHDQGLIPVKCLAFGKAVNVTLGLPIIRTSVDHGTAFDIAGRGVADPGSMIEAILLAARLVGDERSARASDS
jgi:4-hydroxythreonine-4-phosphate dehydrogenase